MSAIASDHHADAAGPAPSSTARSRRRRSFSALLAWVVGILFVLPVLWMVLTSLHTRAGRRDQPADARSRR